MRLASLVCNVTWMEVLCVARLKTVQPRVAASKGRAIATVTPDSWRSSKTSSTQRGYNYKWQKARLQHLADYPLCSFCCDLGLTVAATVVDHKTPHRGDMKLFWDKSNWVSLCANCHSSVKQRIENAELRR